MPNRQAHVAIGAVVAIAVLLILLSTRRRSPTLTEFLGVGTGVIVGALSPDLVEPATSPNHRSAAHSLLALGGAARLSANPPEGLVKWQHALQESADEKRHRRERLSSDHPDRLPLWLVEHGQHFAVGFTIGFPFGYTSHLLADGWQGELPLLT